MQRTHQTYSQGVAWGQATTELHKVTWYPHRHRALEHFVEHLSQFSPQHLMQCMLNIIGGNQAAQLIGTCYAQMKCAPLPPNKITLAMGLDPVCTLNTLAQTSLCSCPCRNPESKACTIHIISMEQIRRNADTFPFAESQ